MGERGGTFLIFEPVVLLAPRVARLSEHEGRGDEHALIASVFVSVPLVLTLAPASGGRTSSTVAPIDGRKDLS